VPNGRGSKSKSFPTRHTMGSDESEINRWGKRRERDREEKHTVEEFG